MASGRILLTHSVMTCNPNIVLYRGYAYMTNSTFAAKHVFRLGKDPDYETSFTVDDSTATVSGDPINVGYSTGRGRLVLRNGAHLNADSITSDSGLGVFEADGATLSPVGARGAFFGGLASAKIGAAGLTIDADYDVTIAQPFSDADDASGEGRLVLAGSATKKLTGDLRGLSSGVGRGCCRQRHCGRQGLRPAPCRTRRSRCPPPTTPRLWCSRTRSTGRCRCRP